MASNLRVDTILPSSGTNVAIGTASGTVSLIGDSNLTTSGNLTIGGNLGVGGTLTYEDVTNIDSVGVITARSGIDAASNLLLKTGGSERVRINSTGNMGLGVSDPNVLNEPSKFQELTLGGKTEGAGIHLKDDNGNVQGGIFTSDNTGAMIVRTITNHYMQFRTNNTERLRIAASGDVSIGNCAVNTFSNYQTLTIGGARAVDGVGIDLERSDGNIYGRLFADANGLQIGAPASGDYIRFETQNTERMRISSAGYVTKPNQPIFDVCGASGNPSGAGYITYTTVKVNIGSHYSTGTGKFTAPVAGTYFFSFGCIKSGNSELARLYLYKNGSSANDRHLRMPTGGDGYGENGALTNIVTLAANDEIQVYMSEGTVHGGTAYLYFNGYLIG